MRIPPSRKKTAVIAGGAGFIGSHLCEYLLKRKWRVICFDNLITGKLENIAHLRGHPTFQFKKADVTQPVSLKESVDVIFNLASPASPRDYFSLPLETMLAGSNGTKNLLELAREKGAVFIQASTSEVYGDPEKHPQDESYWGNVNPIGPRSVYDESKRYAEALVMTYHRLHRIPVRIARIFNTYGPRMKPDDGRVVPNLIYQALKGIPLTIYGTGLQTRSFCYVTDIVNGLIRMIKCPHSEPINLGNPEEFTVLDFAQLVIKLTHTKSKLIFLPPLPDDPRRRCPDITRAKTLLGWQPEVDLQKGLQRTIKWFSKRIQLCPN